MSMLVVFMQCFMWNIYKQSLQLKSVTSYSGDQNEGRPVIYKRKHKSYKNIAVIAKGTEKQENVLVKESLLYRDLSELEILLPCFRQGDKWVRVRSGYRHKSNYFVLVFQSGLPFQLFLECVIKSVPVPEILARSPFPHHVYLIKKSTISKSSDGRLI